MTCLPNMCSSIVLILRWDTELDAFGRPETECC
jgi:hypothetical protein